MTEHGCEFDWQLAAVELLVLRAQRGERSAWAELVEQWDRRLFTYVRSFVESDADACDVLQNVWVTAISKIKTLRKPNRFPAWIYRIARNAALKQRRRLGLRRETSLPENEDVPAEAEPLRVEDAEAVYALMSQLSLAHREVLVLYFLEDLSIPQIGEVIGVSNGTVKSRLYYARQAIKRQLETSSDE